MQELIISN